MADITINGSSFSLKQGDGLTISKERIWSSDTGRTAKGTMKGTLVAKKTKLQLSFPPMSGAEAKRLETALNEHSFFSVTYDDPANNGNTTKTFYVGEPSYPVYSYVSGYPKYVGIGVDLIEK